MDLNLTREETQFRDELRAWLTANVPSDWETHRLYDGMEERFLFLRRWQKRVHQAGWAGVAPYGKRARARVDWPGDHRLRHRKTKEALPSQYFEWR
jgi:hypothetical protein